MIELRANGVLLDVKSGEKIKYTKQVADIADVSTVNASATNSFKLPKTPTNVQMMDFLGFAGDGSQIPYQKVVAQVLENGLPIIKSGWLEVKNTDTNYNVNVKDGIIDFFKAIEGKKLGTDVDLSELNHVKTVQTVIDSFDNEFYTYLVNHYGGKTMLYEFPVIPFNIDYLVPSARIKYLWEKVHSTFGFSFSGSIFENIDYTNAWLTFPKTNSELISLNVANFEVDELPILIGGWVQDVYGHEYVRAFPITWTESEIIEAGWLQTAVTPNRLQSLFITQTSSFQFKLNLSAMTDYKFRNFTVPGIGTKVAPVKVKVFKNGESQSGWEIIGESDELVLPISAVAGDLISFKIYSLTHQEINTYLISQDENPISEEEFILVGREGIDWSSFSVEVFQVEYAESDFNNTFKDFDIPSFIKEVMWRFALVPIIDNESRHITYYTIDELLDESRGVIDFSDKYSRRINESYTIGNYKQNNWLRHKYNTEDSSFNDGNIPVNNANLYDEETLLTSKTYSPNEQPFNMAYIFNQLITFMPTLVWETEAQENSDGEVEIKYKGLTGRYYWLKKVVSDQDVIFASEQLGESETASGFNKASTFETTFRDTTPKYHQGHIRLLNDIRVHDIELNLSISDLLNLDFTRLYYFQQESSYYKLNKVTWEENKPAIGEFIRVKRAQ